MTHEQDFYDQEAYDECQRQQDQERYEQFIQEENERNARFIEQQIYKDYNEAMEICDNCGSYLNSQSHCPNCDY